MSRRRDPEAGPGRTGRLLGLWVGRVADLAPWVAGLTLLGTVAGLFYAASELGIDTDTEGLLSDELDWRRRSLEYKRAFPVLFDNVTVAIEGDTPDLARRAQELLAERLRRPGEPFEEVYSPDGGEWLERHGLLFRSPDRLAELETHVRRFAPWLRSLERAPVLTNYVALLDSTLRTEPPEGDLQLGPVLGFTAEAFGAGATRRFYRAPWGEVIEGRRAEPGDRRRFLLVKPVQDYGRVRPAGPAIERIRELAAGLGLAPERGVRVRLTGQVVMEDEELSSVRESAGLAGILALLAVSLVLWFGLRSGRLIFAALGALVAGLAGTGAFAAVAVGRLNLISVAFAVLYIGLGIDYAAHFCLRYRELAVDGAPARDALVGTAETVGPSLLLSAITTSVSFYAFVPADFAGVSELGLISGTGMYVSFIASLTVLPALLALLPLHEPSPGRAGERPGSRAREVLSALPVRHPRRILAGALLAGALSLLLVPGAHFDHDPVNLRDPSSESVRTYRALVQDREAEPLTVSVVVEDSAAARRTADRLEELESVASVRTLADFVPADQEVKLPRLARIDGILGPAPDDPVAVRYDVFGSGPRDPPGDPSSPAVDGNVDSAVVARRLGALDTLRHGLLVFRPAADASERSRADYLALQMARWRNTLDLFGTEGRRRLTDELERSLLGTLPYQLASLRRSLRAGRVTRDSLPPERRRRWVTGNGRERVEVTPAGDVTRTPVLRRFVRSVREEEPGATGPSVVQFLAGRVAVDAFRTALLWAIGATAVLLLLALRSARDTVLVLLPLLLAGSLTVAFSAVADVPFNFANIIALPLLLGVGVDNGIHMVHRSRHAPPADGNLLRTSTSGAVLVSFLTTIVSFGNLAFSTHRGMASMGLLLTVGMVSALVCTLLVLPVLLGGSRDRPEAGA